MRIIKSLLCASLAATANAGLLQSRASPALVEQTCTPKTKTGYTCRANGALSSGDANLLASTTDLTSDGCRNACRLNSKCISFGWDNAAQSCKLYSKQLRKSGFKPDSSSQITYSNRRHCYGCSTCANTLPGAQWAFYDYNIGNADGQYSSFEPSNLNSLTPFFTGVTTKMGTIQYGADPSPIYDSPMDLNHTYMAMNHHGYIFAPTTGVYTITVSHADDIVLVWTGRQAMTGWTRSNAAIDAYYDNVYHADPTTWKSTTIPLAAGEYWPYRVVYANAQGNYNFEMDIFSPDGTSMMGDSSSAGPNMVQASCDGTAGPAMQFSYVTTPDA